MNLKRFFAELRRRNVYRVAAAYGVVGWLLIQIATQVFPFFDIPGWAIRMVIVVLLLGFPVALIIAWIYELTPQGLQRTDELGPAAQPVRRGLGRKIDFVIIGVLVAIIAVMVWPYLRRTPPADLPRKSIAILPFVDLSETRDQEYLSDGITEQIIDSLAHLHGLLVVARTTAFSFKNKTGDVREIGRQLQVTHILEGSVRHSKGKIRIAAQLINVTDGFHLWSETYDSAEQDLLSLQSDVARKVAGALRIQLHLAETTHLGKALTQDSEAYDTYLRGRYLLNKRNIESIQKGRALFEQAVAKDPLFALGHAGLADAYILLGKLGAIFPAESASKAWTEVSTALSIDNELAEGYVSRAILLNDFEWSPAAGEADYRKALELSPNHAGAHHWYARALAQRGRTNEALAEMEAAEKLDPLSPFIRTTKARILWTARRNQEAIDQCHRALELETNFANSYSVLAQAYLHDRQYPKGIEAAKKYVALSGDTGWAKLELAYAYAVAGDKSQSDRIVGEVTSQGVPFSPYDMATICAVWHDTTGTLLWLAKAVEQRSVDVIWVRVDPRFDAVRNEPGFKDIVARMVPRR